MTTQSETFSEQMIQRVTADVHERTRGHADERHIHKTTEASAQALRELIEAVLPEDAATVQQLAREAARLAAGGWGHSAFRVEVERVTRLWADTVRTRQVGKPPDACD